MSGPAFWLDGRPVDRAAFYATACDPRRHVVVEACAGAGKTWMLVSRIVRALLEGTPAQDILAITFTRKAAGEMRTRLQSWLRDFAAMSAQGAASELVARGMTASQAAAASGALIGLHEVVLASGRSVEIRTFHAWFSQLLRAAPLELLSGLGLAPGLTLIEDTVDLEPELFRAFHAAVIDDTDAAATFRRLAVRLGRTTLRRWLGEALSRRVEIELADAGGVLEAAFGPRVLVDPASGVRDAGFEAAARALRLELGRRDGSTARKAAAEIDAALALADDLGRLSALRKALFTDKGTPRKNLGDLALHDWICARLDEIAEAVAQCEAGEDHLAMVRLSRILFVQYASLKRRRGLIDMADLERVGLALLADHELSGWVQQRLDARVRHLLIDEFQDTSPLQWHALHAWLSAYAGAGGGGEGPRLFIVGDPKQSIYRFRRAEPRVFSAAQRFVVEALGGTLAACDHTRRCAPAVVDAVNRVFGGLRDEGAWQDWRDHTTQRAPIESHAPGLAALPSIERPPVSRAARDIEAPRVWRPSLTVPRHSVQPVLREAEARTVAVAIDELVHGQGMAPGRIFVLARQRTSLRLVADALAARELAFVAPEDTLLAELPEAQDLLAVLDVLASPGQSLSLARALKSPLFGLDDAALLVLAKRSRSRGGWWQALLDAEEPQSAADPALRRAATLMRRWHDAAQGLPPHDLLDRIVHEGDLLARLAAAVPAPVRGRAFQAVSGLLAAALALDAGRFASTYGFVRALRRRRVLAPRAAHPDAVQLLTIHGAKGLEADVVFLMDTEPERRPAETATLLIDWPVELARPRRVAFLASAAVCPPSLRGVHEEELAARRREEFNALYVALTRAADRIVISRTPPHRGDDVRSWWGRLQAFAVAWTPTPQATGERTAGRAAEVIAWPHAPVESAPAPSAPPASADEHAARLGRAVHRWLEWVAWTPERTNAEDRRAFAAAAAGEFGVADIDAVASIGGAILDSPTSRPFFTPSQLRWAGNEVPLVDADGRMVRVDRLVQHVDGAWWVLDYKLAGAPQDDASLVVQLARYRQAVCRLTPGEPVRAAFITARGELIEPALATI